MAPEAVTTTAAVDIPAEEVLPARMDVLRVTGPDRAIEMAGPLAIAATARPRTVTAVDRTAVVAVSTTSQKQQ